MHIVKVTLSDVLDAREQRLFKQNHIRARYRLPLCCFTMNIAGETKDSPLIRFAFSEGVRLLCESIGAPMLLDMQYPHTGPEAYLVCEQSAVAIKKAAVSIENSTVGRLYDIDVLDVDGHKLSRQQMRGCLVCGQPVSACARSRAHGLDRVISCTLELLISYAAQRLSELAVQALLDEVHLTPKPGLVDEGNNGAHTDMDLNLFERSAHVLQPFFLQAYRLGMQETTDMVALRQLGLDAEKRMLLETNGVNTHKGAIFSFMLLLASYGSIGICGGNVFERVSELFAALPHPSESGTHGDVSRTKYGAGGARSEAEHGFPHARAAAACIQEENEFDALLYLLTTVDDTNVLYRGGVAALDYVQSESARIRKLPGEEKINALLRMDAECIKRNISPGGCADMLAMAIFLHRTRAYWDA